MNDRPLRGIIGLAAIGAATAVGVTTHDAGFTALTFIGTLLVPRVLGIGGHHRGRHCHGGHEGPGGRREQMRQRFESRMAEWHREAHAGTAGDAAAAGGTATA